MVSQRWLYLSLEALVHPREKLGPRSASLLRYATGKRVFFFLPWFLPSNIELSCMMFSLASVHWTGVSGGRRRRGPSDSPGSSRWCDAQWHLGPQPIQDSIDISSHQIQQLTIYRSFSPCIVWWHQLASYKAPNPPNLGAKPRTSRAMEGIPWLLLYILMTSPRYTNSFDDFPRCVPLNPTNHHSLWLNHPFGPLAGAGCS